jgi:hypothetical protein
MAERQVLQVFHQLTGNQNRKIKLVSPRIADNIPNEGS